ncbi:MAG: Long-chain-fatty-acid--CoA ligase [Solirubrobacterales bacterium]|nr:Long-chain-fatty-acid--CoA ligase [Solirubrobacterales bacterium]
MTPRTFRLQALGLMTFLAVCAGVFMLMWRFGGGDINPLDSPYRVQAVVPTAVALALHADVRQAGVKIGEVSGVSGRDATAVLQLQLDRDHAPAYKDARVLVRTKTLSGENYVALDPGTPAAGRVPNGGTLDLRHAGQAVQLDQILSTLDRTRRRSLQRALDGLGSGLHGRGADLNRFLEGSSAVVHESVPVNAVLAADRQQVAGLVDDLGAVTDALGNRAAAIQLLTRRAHTLGSAVASRDRALRGTLDALPGFLGQAQQTNDDLGAFSRRATPVVGDLADATVQLAPAVRDLGPAAAETRRTMAALASFTAKATPLAAHLRPFAKVGARFAGPLEELLREFNPLQEYLAPYARDVGGIIATSRAGTEKVDSLGHYSRVVPLVSASSAFGVLSPSQEAALEALRENGLVQNLDPRGHNAYPKPGTAGAPASFSGNYPRVKRDPPYHR